MLELLENNPSLLAGVVGFIFFLLMVDYPWFLRWTLTKILSKFRKGLLVTDEAITYNLCLPFDVDISGKMNHFKTLRECDFGRRDYFNRSGLGIRLRTKSPGSYSVHVGSSIRHLKPLTLFTSFHVVTKLIYFDANALYFEQKIVDGANNNVFSIGITKNQLFEVGDVIKFMSSEYNLNQSNMCPPEVAKWIESYEISVANNVDKSK